MLKSDLESQYHMYEVFSFITRLFRISKEYRFKNVDTRPRPSDLGLPFFPVTPSRILFLRPFSPFPIHLAASLFVFPASDQHTCCRDWDSPRLRSPAAGRCLSCRTQLSILFPRHAPDLAGPAWPGQNVCSRQPLSVHLHHLSSWFSLSSVTLLLCLVFPCSVHKRGA